MWAFALVGVAAVIRTEQQKITHARLVLSGVAPIPWRVTAAKQALVGADATEVTFAQIAENALADAQSLSQNAYKII